MRPIKGAKDTGRPDDAYRPEPSWADWRVLPPAFARGVPMLKELIISSTSLEKRLAILEDGQVTEIFI
ncbi:MAG: hypothetical protein V3T83_13765, partial [Acidobacteriota bacterium]